MLGWWKELKEKWPAYSWPIFLALAAGAICGFVASTYWWSGAVSELREHVALLREGHGNRQLAIAEVTKGPSYRVQLDDDIIQVNNPSSTPITIYLPTGFPRGKVVTIKDKKGNAFTTHINIVSDGGAIDGLQELVINSNKGYYSLIWDGAGWSTI